MARHAKVYDYTVPCFVYNPFQKKKSQIQIIRTHKQQQQNSLDPETKSWIEQPRVTWNVKKKWT